MEFKEGNGFAPTLPSGPLFVPISILPQRMRDGLTNHFIRAWWVEEVAVPGERWAVHILVDGGGEVDFRKCWSSSQLGGPWSQSLPMHSSGHPLSSKCACNGPLSSCRSSFCSCPISGQLMNWTSYLECCSLFSSTFKILAGLWIKLL